MAEKADSGGWVPPFTDPEFAAEAGRKGGLATQRARRRSRLDTSALPKLRTRSDAQEWLECIAGSVLRGDLDRSDAGTAVQAITTWARLEADKPSDEEMDPHEYARRVKEATDEMWATLGGPWESKIDPVA